MKLEVHQMGKGLETWSLWTEALSGRASCVTVPSAWCPEVGPCFSRIQGISVEIPLEAAASSSLCQRGKVTWAVSWNCLAPLD